MFDHLSNSWLIGIGFVLCLILVFTFYKIQNALSQFLHPFKKGKTYWCRITAISDGDTLTCYRFNFRRSETKLRFAYIDAPESTQSYGPESKRLIKKMVYRKVVRVRITDIDRYGRCVGEIAYSCINLPPIPIRSLPLIPVSSRPLRVYSVIEFKGFIAQTYS